MNTLTAALVVILAAASARAQAPAVPAKPAKPVPCWKQAGVEKSAIEKRKGIAESTKAAVAAVCADGSLDKKAKHLKIRDLHKASKEQMDALFTPEQLAALKSCQKSRHEGQEPHPKRDPCDPAPAPAAPPTPPTK
jgi:hypothetical protein